VKPPNAVLEQLKILNQTHRIGHALCRSRNPDFLLEIIQRQVCGKGSYFYVHSVCAVGSETLTFCTSTEVCFYASVIIIIIDIFKVA